MRGATVGVLWGVVAEPVFCSRAGVGSVVSLSLSLVAVFVDVADCCGLVVAVVSESVGVGGTLVVAGVGDSEGISSSEVAVGLGLFLSQSAEG